MAGYLKLKTERKEGHQQSEGMTHGTDAGVQWSSLVVRCAIDVGKI
jgi:hypothetical protein